MRGVRALRAALFPLAFLFLALLIAGCGVDEPQNTFAPAGDVARKQRDLFNWALWPAIFVLISVEGLLLLALLKFRRRRGDTSLPKQIHGHPRLEIGWTIIPALLLLGLAVPMTAMIVDLSSAPAEGALRVNVIGHQWLWEFQYPDIKDSQGRALTIIGLPDRPAELHIPVGRQIDAAITSADVVHSFWVARLAGKTDAIPGRENHMWFNATEPGTYAGQCAEFCGLQHAEMRFTVIAESEQDFENWARGRITPASTGTPSPSPATGG